MGAPFSDPYTNPKRARAILFGVLLMHAGVKLAPAFAATGYDERVRFFPDYFSRLYFFEAVE